MSWRESRGDEHGDIAALMLSLYEEDPAPTPMTRERGLCTLQRLAREPSRGLALAYDRGVGVEGYALLCSFWSNELGGEVCIVDELYVAPGARGRGAATGLLEGLVRGQWPWFQAAVAVELEVTPGNAKARALYERLGFAAYKNALMRHRR